MSDTIRVSILEVPISSIKEYHLTRSTVNLEQIKKTYRQYEIDIFKYLYYRTGDWKQAEKYTAEIPGRMRHFFPTYKQQMSPLCWLMQIARSMAIEYHRQKDILEENQKDEQAEQEIKTPLNRAPLDGEEDDILWALSQMDDLYQDVVIMRFVVGLPLREVATTLHKTKDTVRCIQRRSLNIMQKLISVE